MYVIDAFYGFYTVDLSTKAVKFLVTPDDTKPPMRFPNDIDISNDGSVAYFTDTSTRFDLNQIAYQFSEGKFAKWA